MSDPNTSKAAIFRQQLLSILKSNLGLQLFLFVWGLLTTVGWLAYWPYVQGWGPGLHQLAVVYSVAMIFPTLLLAGIIYLWPVMVIALLGLGLASLNRQWRRAAYRAFQQLLLLLLALGPLLIALLPSFLLGYSPQNALTVDAWHKTYRVAYVAFPIDDNYGDITLMECRTGGLCHQVYRTASNVLSAKETELSFNPDADLLAFKVEGSWVYVQSQAAVQCQLNLAELASRNACDYLVVP